MHDELEDGKLDKPEIGRRRFIKLAAATGSLALPTLLGYGLVREARGSLPPNLSPYAPVDVMAAWPSQPAAASPILLLVNERAENPFGLYMPKSCVPRA